MKLGIRACVTLLVVAISVSFVQAQPRLEWLQTYGDTSDRYYTLTLAEADEGGYYLGGFLGVLGEWHTLMKTDAEGRIEWESEVETERPKLAESVLALPGNQVVASGTIASEGGYWVTSYDENGRILWSHIGQHSGNRGNLLKTSEGDILSVSDFWPENYPDSSKVRLTWFSREGERLRVRDFDCQEFRYPTLLFETENGFEMVGYSSNHNGFATILRVSDEGDSLDLIQLETTVSFYLDKLVRLPDGTYVLPREIYNPDIHQSIAMLTYFGNDGDSITSRSYRMSDRDGVDCYLACAMPELDGSLTLCGSSSIRNEDQTSFLMRVDTVGDSIWTIRFDTADLPQVHGSIPTLDGGYVLAGSYWEDGPTWLLKTTNDTLSARLVFPLSPSSLILHPCFPNPFNSSTTITYDIARPGFVRLGVYDVVGRLVGTVKEGYATPGMNTANWNAEGIGSGTYIFQISTSTGEQFQQRVNYIK